MKHALSIGGIIAVCIIAVPGFWLAHKSRAALEPGILTAQINNLAAGWEAENMPASDRVVNIIISDAQTGSLDKPDKRDSGGEVSGSQTLSDSETLPLADKPPVLKNARVWLKRTFLRKTVSAGANGSLAESLGVTDAVAWTHRGFETASEGEMARELMKAVIKADDAGAEVNIITQGISAAPALQAVRKLKGEARKGRIIAVNKLLALDMNKPTLQKLNPAYFGKFGRPGNLKELVNIWRSPSPPHRVMIELFSQSHKGTWFYADELFPETGLRLINQPEPKATAAERDMLKFVKALVKQNTIIEEVMDNLAEAAKARAEQKKAALASIARAAGADKKEMDDEPEPPDSMAEVKSGRLKEEMTQVTTCNWHDALKYCKEKGGLPTVNELKEMREAECTGAKRADTCNKVYWSSEGINVNIARVVSFYNNQVFVATKRGTNYPYRCAPVKLEK
ncbi:MAG: DUF1566 domain-containing protein [Elusimicrobia bacterium]|nr:DUF1566 domain-containing protein [Elusimicrobiota bacterium]